MTHLIKYGRGCSLFQNLFTSVRFIHVLRQEFVKYHNNIYNKKLVDDLSSVTYTLTFRIVDDNLR